jgi:hypothetical protein
VVTNRDRTVWFPKDSLLGVVLGIPLWGIAGLGWGFGMTLLMNGSLIGWLFGGLFWGATMWVFYAFFLLIAYRELSTNIPLQETATLPERLDKAVKSFRYTVEQLSPTSFVCKSKRGLLALEYTKLHVQSVDGSAHLIGPAVIVNKVRKKLLAGSSMIASRAELSQK